MRKILDTTNKVDANRIGKRGQEPSTEGKLRELLGNIARLLSNDQIGLSFVTILQESCPFWRTLHVGHGTALIYVNAVFDTRKIPNKQGLSAVSLRRKPSFFMLVFCFSATLSTRV